MIQHSLIFVSTDQDDRVRSVEQFRKGEKDVLVATDIASKGLDFPDIQHVINYDMPEDIENYGLCCTQVHTHAIFTPVCVTCHVCVAGCDVFLSVCRCNVCLSFSTRISLSVCMRRV